MTSISVVAPIYNEAPNIPLLYERIDAALASLPGDHEIILVDDGSLDGSSELLDELAGEDPRVAVVHFSRNFGQTAALMAGLDLAAGEVVVTLDGDLQNDPADIPRLLAKLEEGYDVCTGWRKDRRDAAFTRVWPSKVANRIISLITGVHLHDVGCTLRAYRRSALEGVKLYGEMHRYIPIYAVWQGARLAEVVVGHHHRTGGKSKYGLERIGKVLLDLILLKFLDRYSHKPIYLFGAFGLGCLAGGLAFFALMLYFKFWGGKSFVETPLPLLVVTLLLAGFQSILLGLMAEVLMRTYFEAQNKPAYTIDRVTRRPDKGFDLSARHADIAC
jgi:glycosyltransferase involved in cell wall biosynthesis